MKFDIIHGDCIEQLHECDMIFADCKLTEKRIKAFWSKVIQEVDCWVWTKKLRKGYGVIEWGRKKYYAAHRVAYFLQYGIDPHEHFVCHTCDNRACVRGSHLFLGTQTDNMQDAKRKGRVYYPKGEKNGRTILTKDLVKYVKTSPLSQHTIANELGVSRSCIAAIRQGRNWRHVT